MRRFDRYPKSNAMITILASRIRAFMGWESEGGQALVEYSLIMCLVVIVILVTLIVLGNQVRNTYCNIQGAVVGA
jgi:Flp pilus assembly pilin Flp